MGHFHSTNLSKLLLNYIYAKGKASVNDLVEVALKRGEKLLASEGTYTQKSMLQSGFESLVAIHVERNEIEPVNMTDEQKRVWELDLRTKLDYDYDKNGESAGDLAIWDSIQFKFAPGIRAKSKYIVIREVDS